MQVPPSITTLFRAAGWRPSGHVPAAAGGIAESACIKHASAIIAEFGGLRVGTVGPGREQAAGDVHFYSRLRLEVTAVVQPWSSKLGELVAVATAHHDHIIVFVGSAGNFFAFTDPDDQLYSIGRSFGEAMERLLLGIPYGSPLPRDA